MRYDRTSTAPGMARLGALCLVITTTLISMSGCTTTAAVSSSKSADCGLPSRRPAGKLIVEGDPWSGYAPFRPIGNLLPDGLLYKEELDQAKRACDLTTGLADFEVTTIGQYLKNKPDGSIVGVIDQSQGADALVLNTHDYSYLKSIDWVPQLVANFAKQGKRPTLAYTGSSPSEELLNELANTFEDFKPSQFNLVSVDQSSTALHMLDTHNAQMAIVWEPDTTAARSAGNVVAYSSKDVPNSIVDVIIANNSIIKANPAAVQKVIDAYYAFMDDKLANSDALNEFIAKDANLKPEEAKSVIGGLKLYGAKDGDAFMNKNLFPLDEPQVRQSVKAIASLQALSDPTLALTDQMVDGTFVANAAQRRGR